MNKEEKQKMADNLWKIIKEYECEKVQVTKSGTVLYPMTELKFDMPGGIFFYIGKDTKYDFFSAVGTIKTTNDFYALQKLAEEYNLSLLPYSTSATQLFKEKETSSDDDPVIKICAPNFSDKYTHIVISPNFKRKEILFDLVELLRSDNAIKLE